MRIRFAGRRDWRVPRKLIREQDESIELTKGNRKMTLTFAFNYGGRAEIVDAVQAMMDDGVRPTTSSRRCSARYLYDPDMPEPDLVIRTSGEFRISNFLLWELAYSELVFTRRAVARLPHGAPRRRDPRVPGARPPLRRRRT